MAGSFWDTSALVKHYHPELGTPKVDALLQAPGSQHIISRLGVTETFSVFAGKVRAGLVTLPEFEKLCRRFLADTGGKLFSVARLLVAHHKEAERLLRTYAPKQGQGVRTLDALQLAVALDLRNRGVIDALVCSDARLIAVAQGRRSCSRQPRAALSAALTNARLISHRPVDIILRLIADEAAGFLDIPAHAGVGGHGVEGGKAN